MSSILKTPKKHYLLTYLMDDARLSIQGFLEFYTVA